MTDCWRCKGSGQIHHPQHVDFMVDCPTCGGTGEAPAYDQKKE